MCSVICEVSIHNNLFLQVMEYMGLAAHTGHCTRAQPSSNYLVSISKRRHFFLSLLKIFTNPLKLLNTQLIQSHNCRVAFSEDSQRLFALNNQSRLIMWQRKDKIIPRNPSIITFPSSYIGPRATQDGRAKTET